MAAAYYVHRDRPRLERSQHIQDGWHEERQLRMRKQSSQVLENLLSNATNFLKQEKKGYVEPPAFRDGRKKFSKYKSLGIIGGPCCGKSSLVKHIITTFLTNNQNSLIFHPVEITKPEHCNEVPHDADENVIYILILTDIFGKDRLLDDFVEKWLREFPAINRLQECGRIYVIFTCRTIMYNKCKNRLKSAKLFQEKHLLFLHQDAYRLTIATKTQILTQRYELLKTIPNISDQYFIDDVCDNGSYIGFYKWCELDADTQIHSRIFTESGEFLADELRLLEENDNDLYLALLSVLFMNDEVSTTDPFAELHAIVPDFPPKNKLLNNCEILMDTFLRRDKDIVFIEPCVENIVVKLAIKSPEYRRKTIACCSLQTIMGEVSTDFANLTLDDKKCIAERLRLDIDKCGGVSRVLMYKSLQTGSFVGELLEQFNPDQIKVISRCLLPTVCDEGDAQSLRSILLTNIASDYSLTDILTESSIVTRVLQSKTDSVNKLDVLIENGIIKVDYVDDSQQSLLHLACSEGNVQVVKYLIQRCRDINLGDSINRTPLHLAAKIDTSAENYGPNVSKIIQLLLDSGASVNGQDIYGLTSLHLASKSGNLHAIQTLLDKGADATIDDFDDNMTPLMFACRHPPDNLKDVVHLLKQFVDHVNSYGETALHESVELGLVKSVKYLLQNKADPNRITKKGQTPLHFVAKAPSSDVAFDLFKILIEYGTDVDKKDNQGHTLTYLAQRKSKLSLSIKTYLANCVVLLSTDASVC